MQMGTRSFIWIFKIPLMSLLMDGMSEFHVDRLASNLQLHDVHIRVGSIDRTVHPWFSRRMHRLLKQYDVNVTIEEVLGKQHWWWDTLKENDGGVLNDVKMREFYSHCYELAKNGHASSSNFVAFSESQESSEDNQKTFIQLFRANQSSYIMDISSTISQPTSLNNLKRKPRVNDSDLFTSDSTINSSNELNQNLHHVGDYPMHHRCHNNSKTITLFVVNPSTHSGLCGMQVLQQLRVMLPSSVQLFCHTKNSSCDISATNVRRLRLDLGFNSGLFGVEQLKVNGVAINVPLVDSYITRFEGNQPGNVTAQTSSTYLDICFQSSSNQALASICHEQINPLKEKTLVNYGPSRSLYSRPFIIVYGTPSNQAIRVAIKDLAVYLGNSHYSAHGTKVKVLSDLEYRAGNYMKAADLANILFIGGPSHNKLLKAIMRNSTNYKINADDNVLQMIATIPTDLQLSSDINSFALSDQVFDRSNHAILFTLPLNRFKPSSLVKNDFQSISTAMAGCIHGNSAAAYHHISRLAWPVVPPMVRSPFANALPDYMVIDQLIWSKGFGGLLSAGYWDCNWRQDPSRSYSNTFS